MLRALDRERQDFHMAYRIKCDEQTKAAIVRAERAEAERDEKDRQLASCYDRKDH
jgi:hypothetical protein